MVSKFADYLDVKDSSTAMLPRQIAELLPDFPGLIPARSAAVDSTGHVVATFEVITCEGAMWILDTLNSQNRTPRPLLLKQIADDMANGRFIMDANPVRFGENGLLQDAQHRLMAQVEAQVDVEYLVVRGLPDAALNVIDSGAKRSLGDTLGMRGVKYGNDVAAVAQLLYQVDHLGPDRIPRSWAGGTSKSELLEYTEILQEEICDAVNAIRPLHARTSLKRFSRAALATARVFMTRSDPADAETFFEYLAYPEEGITDICGVYRVYLTATSNSVGTSIRTIGDHKVRSMVQLGVLLRGWNDYRQNISTTNRRSYHLIRAGEYVPIPLPV